MSKLIITIFIALLPVLLFGEQHQLHLYNWNQSKGYPGGRVQDIKQDEAGFIWLLSAAELMRFDGTEFIRYKLPKAILEGNNKFLTFSSDTDILVQTSDGRVMMFNIIHQKWQRFSKDISIEESTDQTINKIVNSGIWKGNIVRLPYENEYYFLHNGLKRWNVRSGKPERVDIARVLPDNRLENIILDKYNRIWFSMPLFGIGFYDPDEKEFCWVRNVSERSSWQNGYESFAGLLDQNITKLYFDKQGNLWIGTSNNGIYRIYFEKKRFEVYKFDYREGKGLAHQDISYPLALKDGDVWIGTWGGGINIWTKEELAKSAPEFINIPPMRGVKGRLQHGQVFPLQEDGEGNIWFGTYGGGVHYISYENRKEGNYVFANYQSKDNGARNLPSNMVWALNIDSGGDVWIGTNKGLARHNRKKDVFDQQFDEIADPNQFDGLDIGMIAEPFRHQLWIGTRNSGLFYWNRNTNHIKHYTNNDNFIMDDILQCVPGNSEEIWFASREGLYHLNTHNDQFRKIKLGEGSAINHIESLVKDERNNLWIGTGAGLIHLNTTTEKMRHYWMPGGQQSNSFTQGCSKDSLGYIYMGSRNGMYRYQSSEMLEKRQESPIIIHKLSVNGIRVRGDSILSDQVTGSRPVAYVDTVELDYNQNTMVLGFRTLSFAPDHQSIFEVKLEGFNDKWEETFDTERSYSKLNPGVYRFIVREKSSTLQRELLMIIHKPWWSSWWFILLVLSTTLGAAVKLYKSGMRRARLREQKHQQEEFDRMRVRFFINISHEIRTPLTLIMGGIDKLRKTADDLPDLKSELNRISRNSSRLMTLVNDVLDLKKLDAGKMKMKVSTIDLKAFLESIVDAFIMKEENPRFHLSVPEETVWLHSDREMIETVCYNLMSNAVKFSPPDSDIKISLKLMQPDGVIIEVADKGKGIPQEEQERIFERFYRNEETNVGGSGIGLALTLQLVKKLGGTIEVNSKPGEGSVFSVCLHSLPQNETKKSIAIAEEMVENSMTMDGKPLLLIVDDNPDIRDFVAEIFQDSFRILTAANGAIGLSAIIKHVPDLIITDVMMPEMNGFQLCNEVRNNVLISHIPLILLTAKSSKEAELKAMECLADDYVTKPFSRDVLHARVNRLLKQRESLKAYYRNTPEASLTEITEHSKDEEFINQAVGIIKENLSDELFNVSELADAMAISSSGLYKKVKSMTGLSPVEFIRMERLKEAARLLRKTSYSVTEISEMTGFSSQKYFSRIFRKQFDVSPANYRKS
ncbi:response regulator [Puteibacter caeruleilacunae]|nr:response regulator [Puteibacter caeruleilacunae]